MNTYFEIFVQLLRRGLGISETPVSVPDEKAWLWIFDEAQRQSVAGVVFEGVNRNSAYAKPPRPLLMKWLMMSETLRRRNLLFDQEARRLTEFFDASGIFTAILKGQANEMLYPVKGCRVPGDIDIFVAGGKDFVVKWLDEHGLTDGADEPTYHHVHLKPNEKGITVEVHFRPSSGMMAPSHNRRLQKVLEEEVMRSQVGERGFRVPTPLFHLLMQLAHLHCHFYSGGIGLRHVIDYYYVLRHSSVEDRQKANGLLRSLGLVPMASALMWVLQELLLMEDEYLIIKPNENLGRYLLDDICKGGNFGYYVHYHSGNFFRQAIERRVRAVRLARFGWKEMFWAEWSHLCYVKRKYL